MLIRIIINDFKKKMIFTNNTVELIIRAVAYISLIFCMYKIFEFFQMTMEYKKFITIIFCVNIISIYIVNIVVNKVILQVIKEDSIIVFLKERRFYYIKGRIDLFLIKSMIFVVLPSIIPLACIYENIIIRAIIIIYIITLYYLTNIILIFGTSYLRIKYKRFILMKIFNYISAIILMIGFIFINSYLTMLLMSEIIGNDISVIINIKMNFFSLSIYSMILISLYFVVYNITNKNVYIFFDDKKLEDRYEKEFANNIIKNKYLKNKIIIKDLICFIRKNSILKFIVIIFQVFTMFTIGYIYFLGGTFDVSTVFDYVPILNLIILIQFLPIILLYTLTNYSELNIKKEAQVLRQFSIKINNVKIIFQKTIYLYLISICPIIIAVIIMIINNIGIRFIVELIYVILPMILFGKFITIFIIKFMASRSKAREFKILIFIIVTVLNIILFILGMNPNNTIMLNNIFNIFVIILNFIAYSMEKLGLILFKKEWENVSN